jgi:nucleoside-diphosphate-sugar epimerase
VVFFVLCGDWKIKDVNRDDVMKVLITNGRGFIGVNLIQSLSPKRDVRVLDSLQRASSAGWLEGAADFDRADIIKTTVIVPILRGV